MNFCPHCGGDIRNAGVFPQTAPVTVITGGHVPEEPRVVERAPTVTELMKPVPQPATRADFASDEAWAEFQEQSRAQHRQNRVDAAMLAWKTDRPSEPMPSIGTTMGQPILDSEALLAWHESTARQDGAANAKLLREWREWAQSLNHPAFPQPTDKELVEWARARRAAAEGSAGK